MTQVIINDITPREQFTASGGQTVFNTLFTADATTDINVYARAAGVEPNDVTQLVSTADYTVTFIGATATTRVTFSVGRTAGDIITIARNTPSDRENLYINTNFTPSMLNQDFGLLTLIDQQNEMYDSVLAPHYNVSAIIEPVVDNILPILGANQIWAKNNADTEIIVYDVPASGGLAPKTATYLTQTLQPNNELPNAQVMGNLASGLVVNTTATGVQLTRTLTGTANQVDLSDGNGIAGNPTVSLSSTLNAPGTFTIQGTTVINAIIDDDTFATATATNIPTSESVKAYVDGLDSGNVKSVSGTANRIISTGGANPVIDISAAYVGQSSITTLGTITTGIWNGTAVTGTYGGTGVNNGASTITLGGNLTTSGAFDSIFTMTGATTVTFPTSGTLATVGGTVSSITGTANQIAASASTGPVTLSLASNAILPGTGGVTLPQGNTAAQAGGAGTIRLNTQTSVFEGTVDGVSWSPFSMAAGTVVSVSGTANRITSTGGTTPVIDISASYIGQSSITTLGTIATGVWNGSVIPLAYGGTNANLTASNGGILYSSASAVGILAGTATAGQMLQSGASTTPAWSTSTYPATNAVNTLLYASSANVMSALATANSGVLVTSAGGVPSISTTLPSGIAATNMSLTTPTLGAATATSITFNPTTGGIVGTTTNDNATAGYVGEVISSVILNASAVNIATNTSTNLTSISLTAGDWDVWGNITFNATIAVTNFLAWISAASATLPDTALVNQSLLTSSAAGIPAPFFRASLSGTTTIYLTGYATISSGTANMRGQIYARRVR